MEKSWNFFWKWYTRTSLIPGPVKYDMRQNQPALYQDQSNMTWGKTNQPYTRTSQVWPEAIATSLIIPVPDWYEIQKESRHPYQSRFGLIPKHLEKFLSSGAVWTVAHECLGFHSFNSLVQMLLFSSFNPKSLSSSFYNHLNSLFADLVR